MKTRDAAANDAAAIARIDNEGIDDRVATFEMRHRTADDVVRWFDGRHPVVVVEDDDGEVIAMRAGLHRPSESIHTEFLAPIVSRDDKCGASC
jgi:L-amino acid N-acyltransferase YncA